MTLQEAQQQLRFALNHIYPDTESNNIADWVMEHITGLPRIDRVMNKNLPLLEAQVQLLQSCQAELLQHKPVQYVLKEAWFCGMKLYVDESVLIPRPETEELVDWIVRDLKAVGGALKNIRLMDIGTGSGCIPLGIKKQLPQAAVYAMDISEAALKVAEKNAADLSLEIRFLRHDILSGTKAGSLPVFDVIVSNPPYIPVNDKEEMRGNVLNYEPWLALFVENDDPLCFYKAILDFANEKLSPEGSVYFEIHEAYAKEIVLLAQKMNFSNTIVKKDMQGKDRMICVFR